MEVAHGQQLLLTGGKPLVARSRLALRAMPVTTGIIRDGLRAAARTLISMAAQRCGAAACNGLEHFDVLPVQPRAVLFDEPIALRSDNISHLEGWPIQLLCFLRRGVS